MNEAAIHRTNETPRKGAYVNNEKYNYKIKLRLNPGSKNLTIQK